ncbi:hypothetical protein [Streptomyces sp. NPDC059468]|uniref:hypothetical protein n=1 Tax=Streptomyces sp. NPDC059468 TaxID=3346845 RepID=UPI003691E9E0
MTQKKAPFTAGSRVAIMYDHSLAPGIVISLEQGSSGTWRGDVRTEDGVLVNRSLHPDYVQKESRLEPSTRASWQDAWERLEAASS